MKRAMHSRTSRAILAAALILSIGAAPIYANNILDQAVARAALAGRMAAVAQAQPCPADITRQAISNAETRGTGGALANGVLLPFAAIAMVRGTDIEPPASALVGLDREEVRCYGRVRGTPARAPGLVAGSALAGTHSCSSVCPDCWARATTSATDLHSTAHGADRADADARIR